MPEPEVTAEQIMSWVPVRMYKPHAERLAEYFNLRASGVRRVEVRRELGVSEQTCARYETWMVRYRADHDLPEIPRRSQSYRVGEERAQTRAALAVGVQAGDSAPPARARRGGGEAARRARIAHPLIQQLTQIRYEADLSGRQVAEIGGFFPGLIAQWEVGNRHPSLESITTWANALGYDLVLRKRGTS